MAFKMKGSAFKLGNVATKSALKHSGAKFAAESKKESPNSKFDFAKAHNDNFAPGHTEHTGEQNEPQPGSKEYKRRKKAEKAKDDSGVKMKSPMKGEKKMIDGVEVHPDGHEGHHRVGKAANQKWGRGKSPAKHKKKVKKGGHGAGGIGRVAPVTAEQVKAHDDKYGEGHDDSHKSKKTTAAAVGAGGADFLINLAKTEAEKKKGTKTKK